MSGFNPFSAIADIVGGIADFVVSNALPIIETVALTTFLGPEGIALGETLGISDAAVTAISRVAVTALNGGSIGSIVAAGLTPMLPDIGKALNVNLDAGSFISKPIADALGNTDLAKIVASAAGSAVTGGAIAAVTGGDVLQAAAMAGLSPIVAKGVASTWAAIKDNLPAIEAKQQQLDEIKPTLQNNTQILDGLNRFQNTINNNYDSIQNDAEYQKLIKDYKANMDGYNAAKDAGNISLANSYASAINNDIAPKLQNNYTYNTLVPTYQSQVDSFNSLISQNKDVVDQAMQANTLQNQIDTMSLQVQSDYTNYQMSDALAKGNYTDAAKYFTDLQTYNSDLLKLDPNALTTAPSLSTTQANFLSKYATDPSQYGAQASQVFADYKTTPVDTTSITNNPYDQLPKYPGTDTTTTGTTTTDTTGSTNTGTTTTQQTTPPSSHVSTSTLSPITNTAQNIVSNLIKQGFTNTIIGGITGGNGAGTGTQPKPTVQPPAKHVDVSSLKPFTGSLPTGLPSTTPTTTPTTTQTSGLGTVTNTATTPTQMANSGLQSTTQPQTQLANKPASHVDISTLTPVTNTTQLANLDLNLG